MRDQSARWKAFWQPIQTPMHRDSESGFHDKLARELRSLLEGVGPFDSVLDIGCGNGVLYEPLGFDRIEYTGVDFSGGMLDDFRRRHPRARLVSADGARYRDGRKYGLIFSSGVVQFFDRRAMRDHFGACREALAPGGAVVHASVPWKSLRWWYRAGWGPGREPYAGHPLKRLARPLWTWWNEKIGHWYNPTSIARMAREAGFDCQFYGSTNFLYRFHFVLTPSEQALAASARKRAA